MTLVIDDWHLVTGQATSGALRYLLDNMCAGLTVVVTGRNQVGLPMSRMRMQDELVEIDATALRFDTAEAEQFLIDLCGLDLDRSDVEELTAKTDGWVAALQLASLLLRGAEDPARLIGTMTGHHYAISEFLAENVLDTLEPSMLDFLLATSITERTCGELASALSGMPDGQAMLEQVEERDLFLQPRRRAVVSLLPAVPRFPAAPAGAGAARAGRRPAPHRLHVVRRAPDGQRSGRPRACCR